MQVTIVGAGNMGRGIGSRAVAGGNDVELVDRNPEDSRTLAEELGPLARIDHSVTGEVVVLALPYDEARKAIAEHRDAIAGRIAVDIVNPVEWSTMDTVTTPADTSAAKETARPVPEGTRVVKAFNTTFAKTLVAGEADGQKLEVLIASDDDAAKATVAALVEAGGMRATDVGPLRRARILEQVGLFHIAIQEQLGSGFASAISLRLLNRTPRQHASFRGACGGWPAITVPSCPARSRTARSSATAS
ncbi:MAG TPA: NAD(P)-binding domain-containing protein [Trebonia sp.]|nr:NAD(P)-binding domain-containing protein [Trebonia sp.]